MPAISGGVQYSYLFRNDDGTEVTASSLAGIGQEISIINTIDFPFRLRIGIDYPSLQPGAGTFAYQLQYQLNNGAWANISTSTTGIHLASCSGSHFADHDPTTALLNRPSTDTFVAGSIQNNDDTSSSIVINTLGGQYTELEWMLTTIGADLSRNDALSFRVIFSSGSLLGTYNVTPTIFITALPPVSKLPLMGAG